MNEMKRKEKAISNIRKMHESKFISVVKKKILNIFGYSLLNVYLFRLLKQILIKKEE